MNNSIIDFSHMTENDQFLEIISERFSYLQKFISEAEAFLPGAPPGHLVCRHDRTGACRYYSNYNGKQAYISAADTKTAQELALKTFYSKVIGPAKSEAAALRRAAKNTGIFDSALEKFILKNPECAALISHVYSQTNMAVSDVIDSWLKEEYEKNTYYPEYLIHETIKGEKVRSKSEASIANVLALAGLPYRYECRFDFGNETFYPDFMILNPIDGKIYIWEHFGLVEIEKYLQKTAHKMQVYTAAGYFPGKNLITTYEDASNPFTAVQAAKTVYDFFGRKIMPV